MKVTWFNRPFLDAQKQEEADITTNPISVAFSRALTHADPDELERMIQRIRMQELWKAWRPRVAAAACVVGLCMLLSTLFDQEYPIASNIQERTAGKEKAAQYVHETIGDSEQERPVSVKEQPKIDLNRKTVSPINSSRQRYIIPPTKGIFADKSITQTSLLKLHGNANFAIKRELLAMASQLDSMSVKIDNLTAVIAKAADSTEATFLAQNHQSLLDAGYPYSAFSDSFEDFSAGSGFSLTPRDFMGCTSATEISLGNIRKGYYALEIEPGLTRFMDKRKDKLSLLGSILQNHKFKPAPDTVFFK